MKPAKIPYPTILDIIVEPCQKLPRGFAKRAQQIVNGAVSALPAQCKFPASATLMISDNATVKVLNHDFRGINKPTNVLSFPQFTPRQISKFKNVNQPLPMGDIVIALPYSIDEAVKAHKKLTDHLLHLTLHGFLHLYGYDHIMDKEAVHMEGLERRILTASGLPDPYEQANEKEPKRGGAAAVRRTRHS